jgi:type IV pilus assembly protein PilE
MTTTMRSRHAGFSLMELLIVVAIVGILASIGYSSYSSQQIKSRRAEARALVQALMQHEERYYTVNNQYTTTLTAMGYAATLHTNSNSHNITLAAGPSGSITTSVTITATALKPDAQCTSLTLTSTNVESGAGSLPSVCW